MGQPPQSPDPTPGWSTKIKHPRSTAATVAVALVLAFGLTMVFGQAAGLSPLGSNARSGDEMADGAMPIVRAAVLPIVVDGQIDLAMRAPAGSYDDDPVEAPPVDADGDASDEAGDQEPANSDDDEPATVEPVADGPSPTTTTPVGPSGGAPSTTSAETSTESTRNTRPAGPTTTVAPATTAGPTTTAKPATTAKPSTTSTTAKPTTTTTPARISSPFPNAFAGVSVALFWFKPNEGGDYVDYFEVRRAGVLLGTVEGQPIPSTYHFADNDVEPGGSYTYQVRAISSDPSKFRNSLWYSHTATLP